MPLWGEPMAADGISHTETILYRQCNLGRERETKYKRERIFVDVTETNEYVMRRVFGGNLGQVMLIGWLRITTKARAQRL